MASTIQMTSKQMTSKSTFSFLDLNINVKETYLKLN